MNPKPTLDQTDAVILYMLRQLTKGVPNLLIPGDGVLTTMLAKLLFLLDVWSVQIHGEQATNFKYIRYKHGPYPLAQFDQRLERLASVGVDGTPGASKENGHSYRVYRLVRDPGPVSLPDVTRVLADEALTTFSNQKLEEVLDYVYSLEFVKRANFGETIDLGRLRPAAADVLAAALKEFASDLREPSAEHLESVEASKREPSNENVELARVMAETQRKAFRRKHDP